MNLDEGNYRKLQTELKQSSHCYWGVFNAYNVNFPSLKTHSQMLAV